MKTRKYFIITILTVIATLAISCERDASINNGEEINFNVAINYDNSQLTRTEYGYYGTAWQQIKWLQGDMIHITSDLAATSTGSNAADYTVISESHYDNRTNTYASISSTTPLLYANETQKFYALYPAPGSDGVDEGVSMDGNVATLVIPEEQSEITMKYAYMSAGASTCLPDVSLKFCPMFNAFGFELYGDEDSETVINSITIEAESGVSLSGTYKVTIASGNYTVSDVSGSNKITATFTSGVTLPKPSSETPWEFTMFAIAQRFTSLLTVTINATINGVAKTMSLPLTDDEGTVININREWKFFIKSTLPGA